MVAGTHDFLDAFQSVFHPPLPPSLQLCCPASEFYFKLSTSPLLSPRLTFVVSTKHLKTLHSCKAVTLKKQQGICYLIQEQPMNYRLFKDLHKVYTSASLHLLGQACFRAGHTGVGQVNKRTKIQLQQQHCSEYSSKRQVFKNQVSLENLDLLYHRNFILR